MSDVIEVKQEALLLEQAETVVLLEVEASHEVLQVTEQQTVLVDGGKPTLIETGDKAVLITEGIQGPPGIPGPAGGQVLQRMAGMAISALVAVFEDLSGAVWPADPNVESDVLTLLGVTITAAQAGQPIHVQRVGHIDDSSWQWQP